MAYEINEQLISHNRSGEHLGPIGYVIHSTDNTKDTEQGERNYFNDNNLSASVHYFVGDQIIRCIPENEVAWGCGPTGNHRYLQVEMCEGEVFAEVWARTVWLVADACIRYGWATGPDVWSHRGISAKYHETTHTDPIEYLQRNGKTWEQLLSAIDAMIITLKTPAPAPSRSMPTPKPTPQSQYLTVTANPSLNVRKSASTSSPVIGSLKNGAKVKIGFIQGDWANIYFGDHGGYVASKYLK